MRYAPKCNVRDGIQRLRNECSVLKIAVKDFGKIANAEVQLSPLMLLVGKNNTGKSYLATLIWAMSNLGALLQTDHAKETRPAWFSEFVDAPEKPRQLTITAEMMADVASHVNHLFAEAGGAFLANTFAFDGFSETQLSIANSEDFPSVEISIATAEEAGNDRPRGYTEVQFSVEGQRVLLLRYQALVLRSTAWTMRVYGDLVGLAFFGKEWMSYRTPLYIPAARTGLMLALRSLVSQSLELDNEPPAQTLPRPLASFLQRMSYPSGRPRDQELLDWFTKDVAHGHLERSGESEFPDFSYKPENSSITLPLYATSSMITEVAPFMIAIGDHRVLRYIVFEEPEAHLHLAAQRSMARAIARLVAMGVKVVVTTHSDTFVQQINNLMQLYGHRRRDALLERFGYEKNDLIDPSTVSAYEFVDRDGKTSVTKLASTTGGFVVNSLNETLISLAEETVLLQEDVDD